MLIGHYYDRSIVKDGSKYGEFILVKNPKTGKKYDSVTDELDDKI